MKNIRLVVLFFYDYYRTKRQLKKAGHRDRPRGDRGYRFDIFPDDESSMEVGSL